MKRRFVGLWSILLVAIAVVGGGVWLRWDTYRLDGLRIELMQAYRAYAQYICDHDGAFPVSPDDLLSPSYLAPKIPDDAKEVVAPSAREGEFLPAYPGYVLIHFGEYTVRYGGAINELELRQGVVCEKNTGEPVVFIQPRRRALTRASVEYTARTFQFWSQLCE